MKLPAQTRALLRGTAPIAGLVAIALLATLSLAAFAVEAGPASGPAHVNRIRIDSSINPATADYLDDAIERSRRDGAAALVVTLDTPGGLLASTRTMVQRLLAAPLPVIVYVAPSGAGAASAGVFIVMAAHVAAMAPGTSIGASTPVSATGGEIEGDLGQKVKSFTASFAKAIATERGRNVDWAAKAVTDAVSATDGEALKLKVIDLIAPDVDGVLRAASGRVVTIAGEKRTLALEGARIVDLSMHLRQRLLNFLADPNLAYLLLLAGLLGLYLELSHPGTMVPGVAGAVCLLIALASFQVLPINTAGLLLLLLGLGMLVAELFLPSFGVVGVGGLVAFVLGSLFLFDVEEPGIRVDRPLIGGAATAVGLIMLAIATLVVKSMRGRAATGREALIGEICEVRAPLNPRGTVFVQGELWKAVSKTPMAAREQARIVAVEGLSLRVEPVLPRAQQIEEEV